MIDEPARPGDAGAAADPHAPLVEETPSTLSSAGATAPGGAATALTPGALVGVYTLGAELGRGGMGIVYEAYDARRRETVALKTLQRMSPAALYRFKQEFRVLAGLAHPNLVPLYELISDGQLWVLTMKLVRGVSWLEHVRAGPGDAALRVRDALGQFVLGVDVLHGAGVLHRDLKPSNVLVTAEGRVTLVDFGLAAELNAAGVHESAEQPFLGTAAYMAPEQARGAAVSPATDWYSVGVMLYEALVGRLPFRGTSMQILLNKQRANPPAPAQLAPTTVPEDLNALCVALLQRDPAARPRGAEILTRLGASPRSARLPSSRGARPASHALVGRDAHVALLQDAFATSAGGRPVAVYVHGRSGTGKTALVRSVLDDLIDQRRAVVLMGRCFEAESVPYKALDDLVDALSTYLRSLPKAEAAALLPRDVELLTRLFPVLRRVEAVASAPRRALDIPDVQEVRRRAFGAFRELLARLGDRRPLILWIDDLQWGDVDSATYLSELLRHPDPPSLLFVGSYRTDDVATSACLRRLFDNALGSGDALDERPLAVEPLVPAEAQRLAAVLLSAEQEATHGQAEIIARESGGNPFFITELVQHVLAGAGPRDALGAGAEVALDEMIWTRVRRLSADARCLLEVVALSGHPLEAGQACEAAAIEGDGHEALGVLRSGRLVRTSGAGVGGDIEPYHDRVRESILARLPAETLIVHHRRLAQILEAAGTADPEVLAVHFHGAGDRAKAARYAETAAAEAAAALAFDRAARLYRLALELGTPEPSQARELRIKLAEALANAGRGGESARIFQKAAEQSSGSEQIELQRRAAEQFLFSGHIDEGLSVLANVLKSIGLHFPSTSLRAVLAFLWGRVWLRCRGLGFQERPENQVAPSELLRIDTCWSASVGLAIVDTMRGSVFQTHHTRLALRSGELGRIARAIAMEGGYSATAGTRSRRRTERVLSMASVLAERVGTLNAKALVTLTASVAAHLEGRWKNGADLGEEAERMLREHCTGMTWELDSATFFWCFNHFCLGNLSILSARLPTLLQDAQARGDLYAVTMFRTFLASQLYLARDEPTRGLVEARAAMDEWAQTSFNVQHFWWMWAEVQIALYTGDVEAASRFIEMQWPLLRQSQLLRVQFLHIQTHTFLGRTLLAMARDGAGISRDALLKRCVRVARIVERNKARWGNAQAALLRAGISSVRANVFEAERLLRDAERRFQEADMSLYVAVCRRRRGQLMSGADGRELIQSADLWMAGQGIVNPERMADALAPGMW